jgi:nicotinic acetylcholine receptor
LHGRKLKNEPAQNIKMNVWMIQKWRYYCYKAVKASSPSHPRDEMLDWDPREYDMINSTILPHEALWIPDTYLFYTGIFLLIMNILRYNSVVMSAEETERYMNIRADSLFWEGKKGANMFVLKNNYRKHSPFIQVVLVPGNLHNNMSSEHSASI